jgi:DNA-binding transcriptional LysR family regulator
VFTPAPPVRNCIISGAEGWDSGAIFDLRTDPENVSYHEGVVLGRSALVADELAVGHLVRPFELSLPAGFAYYVVHPQRALQRPSVKVFRDWLMAEARRA